MRPLACIALLLVLSACAASVPDRRGQAALDPRLVNLQRAAVLPWRDGGQCAVREASQPWSVLVERCFQALDHDHIRFNDPMGRCAVASVGAAAVGLGVCVLAAPEIAVGAVIIIGVVVVAAAIQEELDAYERRATRERAGPETQPRPSQQQQEPVANGTPKQKGSPLGRDWLPPLSTEPTERRPECEPIPGPPRGGNDPHNLCADNTPGNDFPGLNVFVNGKHFDALVLATRTLWEVKTDDFDKQPPRSQAFFVRMKLPEIQRERELARACGYHFVVGVRSRAHKEALLKADNTLDVVIMDWC